MDIETRNLAGLRPEFREKVRRILRDMEKYLGYRCYVASGLRTEAEQRRLVAQGRSKTNRSRHLKGLAADIVPVELGWNAPPSFWLRLGYLAEREGLGWGGFYGLPRGLRAALRKAYGAKDWEARVKIGWDPAHVETAR